MESVTLVLEIFLPTLSIGLTAFLIIRSYLKYEESRQQIEIEKTKQDIIFPARMQAYERIILFLERSTPESLIRRVIKGNSSARLFQSELISAVRSEYDHNLSQQVYMSPNAWSMVKTATEETIRLVNISASKLSVTATAPELAENMLQITSQIGKFPTQVAIDSIKKEFAQYFLTSTNAGA
ncbi:MAG TPA: hypothetical protein VNY36_05705 [Bacteroidia bacterium]|jgi:hypothetical protein|nr:hypothetical protein [Bacteroidia bacterium]